MVFLQVVLISILLYGVYGARLEKAYLLHNASDSTIDCYDLPSNKQCPANVINYKVFGLKYGDSTSKIGLQSVKLMMTSLKFFKEVTKPCAAAVREYACANTFGRCVKDASKVFGVSVTYDVARTKRACGKVKKHCSHAVQEATVANCTTVMKNFMDLGICKKMPKIDGDFCPKTNFKFPKPNVDFYRTNMGNFNKSYTKIAPLLQLSRSCEQKFRAINCQVLQGPICSRDKALRLYAISEQQCTADIKNCLTSVYATLLPNLKPYYLTMCKLFPDATKAKTAPLPKYKVGKDST